VKLLCFSDIHLTNRNSKFKKTGGVSDLLLRQEKYIDHIVELADEKQVDAILFLGDWTDYPTLDPVTLTYSNRLVKHLTDHSDYSGCPVIFIEGNHCISDRGNKFTVVGATNELINHDSNTSFVYQPDFVSVGDVCFHCFPYSSDYPNLEAAIAATNDDLPVAALNIMLFHFPTVNAVLDNGLQSKKGVNLSAEITDNFDLIIGGDFHYHQQLINNENAYYVGAPFSLRFGEHCDRGTVIFDIDVETKEYELEFISNPHQFPIRKATYDEVMGMTDEELMNGVYRVLDLTDAQYLKLAALQEKCYKLDISRPKIKKHIEEKVGFSGVTNSSRDVLLVQSRLETTELNDTAKENVTKLFETIKGEIDE
jgi:DNA repair exonuclease SbcCD nuclease subunit